MSQSVPNWDIATLSKINPQAGPVMSSFLATTPLTRVNSKELGAKTQLHIDILDQIL